MKSMKPMKLNKVATLLLASTVLMGYSSCSEEDDPVVEECPIQVNKFQVFGQVYTAAGGTPLANVRIAALAADDTKREVAFTTTQKDGYFVLSGKDAIFMTMVPDSGTGLELEAACVRLMVQDPDTKYWTDTIYSFVHFTEKPQSVVPKLALIDNYMWMLEDCPSYCGMKNIKMKPAEPEYNPTYEGLLSCPATIYVDDKGVCRAWLDGGGVASLTNNSIYATLGDKGFGDSERAYISCKYDQSNYSVEPETGKPIVKDAELYSCTKIPVAPILMAGKSVEEDSLIAVASQPDSLHSIESLHQLYVYNGYLSVDFETVCPSKEQPTLTVVCDEVKEDGIHLRMLLNRHTGQGFQTGRLFYSYKTSSLLAQVGSTDSVMVHVSCTFRNKADSTAFKVSRWDLIPMEVNSVK
jgi:hypothetical protein